MNIHMHHNATEIPSKIDSAIGKEDDDDGMEDEIRHLLDKEDSLRHSLEGLDLTWGRSFGAEGLMVSSSAKGRNVSGDGEKESDHMNGRISEKERALQEVEEVSEGGNAACTTNGTAQTPHSDFARMTNKQEGESEKEKSLSVVDGAGTGGKDLLLQSQHVDVGNVEVNNSDVESLGVPSSVEFSLPYTKSRHLSSTESCQGWRASGKEENVVREKFEETQTHPVEKEWDSDILVALERFHLGDFSEAMQLFQSALEWRVAVLGTDHEHISLIREKLGDISMKMGRYQHAELFYDLAIRHLRTKAGSINKDVARILLSQGDLYRKMGEHSLALKRYKESLSVRKKLLAVEKSQATPCSISSSRMTHNGSFESAASLFSVVITGEGDSDAEKALPYTLSSIGNLQFRQGDYSQAIKYYKMSLMGYLDIRRSLPAEVCGTMSNLGKAYFENKEYDMAITCLMHAVKKLRLSDLPKRDIEVAMLWTKIGSAYFRKGDYEAAMEFYTKSLDAKYAIFTDDEFITDENHPEILLTRHDMGLVLCKQGQLDDAMTIFEDIKLKKIETGDANGVDYAKLLIDMSSIHMSRGEQEELDKADNLCDSAREILMKAKLPGWHSYFRQIRHTAKKINLARSAKGSIRVTVNTVRDGSRQTDLCHSAGTQGSMFALTRKGGNDLVCKEGFARVEGNHGKAEAEWGNGGAGWNGAKNGFDGEKISHSALCA